MYKRLTLEDYIHFENKFGVRWLLTQPKPVATTSETLWVCCCGEIFKSKYERVKHRNDRCGCGYRASQKQRSLDIFSKYVGDKYNSLSILELKFVNNKSIFVCECDCGNIKDFDPGNVLRIDGKATRTCGCSKTVLGKENIRWKGGKYISGKHWYTIRSCKHRSSRTLEFNITLEYVEDLLEKQNFKCAISGVELTFLFNRKQTPTASLDRIDNSKGYVVGNVQWVHKIVNELKWDLTQQELVDWCHKISDFQRK
jgi:hypothetical protein